MDIPELNISITKAAINGQVVDVINYDEYTKHHELYDGRTDVAIPIDHNGQELLLPLKGKYNGNPISPGIYPAGPINFIEMPEDGFASKYIAKDSITMSNNDDIAALIAAGDIAKRLDEPFITTPDNITTIPIRDSDQPEMKCLKMALNAKHIDIDKYASRFGDNYPNDKRQLKSTSATLNIIKRYCNNCDMEAILILKDRSPDVPNPMGTEISISLTDSNEEYAENYDDEEVAYDAT